MDGANTSHQAWGRGSGHCGVTKPHLVGVDASHDRHVSHDINISHISHEMTDMADMIDITDMTEMTDIIDMTEND